MTRKRVTIVFCDVAGSTALGESIDPEALRSLLARYFERMQAIVSAHGGTVEKFIGDAVMAVFGELVARGLPTDAIAARLHLSRWTVQDHLKAIFEKVGVATRGELVARVFFGQRAPQL